MFLQSDLPQQFFGPSDALPVRDIGLLASEGRVTIPLQDRTPAGVLDTLASFYEFIPADQWEREPVQTLAAELATDAMKAAIHGLGGYDTTHTGEVEWVT